MKIVRCDTNTFVLRHQNRMLFVSLAIALLAIPLAVWGLPHSTGSEPLWALLAFLSFGPLAICLRFSYEDTYVLERNARRILILRKFVAWTVRRELKFDRVASVDVRTNDNGTDYAAIVLTDGGTIKVLPEGKDPRTQRRECRGTVALLRDILGLTEAGQPELRELATVEAN